MYDSTYMQTKREDCMHASAIPIKIHKPAEYKNEAGRLHY
jgi:hypothetical protein